MRTDAVLQRPVTGCCCCVAGQHTFAGTWILKVFKFTARANGWAGQSKSRVAWLIAPKLIQAVLLEGLAPSFHPKQVAV